MELQVSKFHVSHIKISGFSLSAKTANTGFSPMEGCPSYQRNAMNAGRGGMLAGAPARVQLSCAKLERHLHTKSVGLSSFSMCALQSFRGRMSLFGPSREAANSTFFRRKGSLSSQRTELCEDMNQESVAAPLEGQIGCVALDMPQLHAAACFCGFGNFRIPTKLHRPSLLAVQQCKHFWTSNLRARQPLSAYQRVMSPTEKNLPDFGLTSGLRGQFDTMKELWINFSPGALAWRNGCQFLVALLALSLFGATVQTPPSFGETLIESPGIASRIELPPLPSEYPDLGNITPLSYEQLTLSNGLRVFLLEDHELGLVGGELLVRGGGKLEPADKVGLAAISAIVQRSGGSRAHPAEELDSQLEVMAARIEASSSVSEMTVGFRCLTEDLDTVFSLFSEVIQEPLMPQDKLDFIRSQFLGGIARRPDDAAGISAREFNKLLYGSESVYARVPEVATVSAISRDDLQNFHRQNFRPETGVLGIWGDFDSKTVKRMVENKFGGWTVETQSVTPVLKSAGPALERGFSASQPSVYVIDRPGLTQGYVRMGEFGTTLADPDVFSLDILNGILNGFGGLLFDEVRSREGLAYSVSGGWSPAVEHRGAFIAGGETRVQAIPQFVQAVKRVLNTLTSDIPDADTLARAKEAALNSFVFNFTDSGSQLVRVMSYELFGIDQDFLSRYKKGVEATTALDVLKAAQRHLHVNAQPILIVTDAQQLPPLASVFDAPVITLKPNYVSKGGAVTK